MSIKEKGLVEITKKVVTNEGLKAKKIWKKKPEKHDYPAALDYLELVFTDSDAKAIVKDLKKVKITHKKAKDILRASELPLLPIDNVHVKANIDKVNRGEKLSPVLLAKSSIKLIIADGYHRVCAIYYLSEDYNIPCKLSR